MILDDAMYEYYSLFGKKLDKLRSKPQLSDYYVPSNDQKNRELIFYVLDRFWWMVLYGILMINLIYLFINFYIHI